MIISEALESIEQIYSRLYNGLKEIGNALNWMIKEIFFKITQMIMDIIQMTEITLEKIEAVKLIYNDPLHGYNEYLRYMDKNENKHWYIYWNGNWDELEEELAEKLEKIYSEQNIMWETTKSKLED